MGGAFWEKWRESGSQTVYYSINTYGYPVHLKSEVIRFKDYSQLYWAMSLKAEINGVGRTIRKQPPMDYNLDRMAKE